MKSFTRLILTTFAMLSLTLSAAWAQVSVTASGGTTSGSYSTISAAFAAINAGTHTGSIQIAITADVTEPAAVTALEGSGVGSASYSAVSIQPVGNRIVSSAATPTTNRGLVELKAADNVTIDGDDPLTPGVRNLTFQMATSTNITAVIRISSNNTLGTAGADNNTVKNCIIIGSRPTGTSTTMSYGINASNYSTTSMTTGAYGNLNTTIDNNEFRRCHRGIYLNGASATFPNTGVYVTNNILGSANLADNIGLNGIFVSYSNITGGSTLSLIEGNDIRCGDVSPSGAGYSASISGIDLGTVNSGIRVLRNNIHDIMQPTSFGYGSYGINVSGSAQCENILIANNMINNVVAAKYTTSPTSTYIATGIRFSAGATAARLINNTIVVNAAINGSTANYTQHGIYLVSTMTAAQILNNIVINNGVGTGSYAIYSASTANINTATVNNNNYSAPSGVIGFYNGVPQATLANWQTASGKDANTFNVSPNFVSANDLHITTAPTPLESGGAAVGVTLVANDIDNQLRPGPVGSVNGGASNPDIGADEFDATPIFAPVLTFGSIAPLNCNTAIAHPVTATVTPGSGTLSSVVLNYAFNGVAQTPINMTNTSGSSYEATIPVATPVNATVTWSIAATNSYGLVTPYTGTTYQDEPLLGLSAYSTTTNSVVCSGSASSVNAVLYPSLLPATTAPTYTNPTVSNALSDEDFGSITISQSGTTLLTNTSTINTLTGTLGVATGTAGAYSDFTALATTGLTAGQSYDVSLTSLTTAGPYNNFFAVFLDLNRNGSFSDPGETVYVSPSSVSGAHTVTGTFTVPASAFNGLTRMRVMNYESFAPSATYINAIGYGEFEDYLINMSGTIQGGGSAPIPAITSVSWSDGTSVVGTGNPLAVNPTVTTTYTGTVTAGGCQVVSSPITVTALVLPATPIATNSTQCGTQVPTASVASAAGVDGAGMFYWYDAATSGAIVQNPPVASAWTTFFTDDFNGASVAAGAITNGSANLTNTPGWLQLTAAANGLQGGITVNAGVNAQAYKVEFDVQTTTGGADGFSWSFAPDANATATSPAAEMGTGTKVKISFDAYGAMPNGAGTYLLYNNTATSFNATTAGVLAFNAATPWLGAASAHVIITINETGQLSMSVDGVDIFTNVALPAAYLTQNKATWKHVISARTGGLNMLQAIDNLSVAYKLYAAGSTTYTSVLANNATFYVAELGTNGCLSATAPIAISVSQPAPITYNNSPSAICIGGSVTLNMSSTITPAYTYTVSSPNPGAGIVMPVTGASQTFTPTASGSMPYVITAANGNCTEVDTVIFNVVPSAPPAPIIAIDTLTICPSATSAAFTATPSSMSVNYTFNLLDSYGDGWNGNALKVLYNGVLAQTLTFTSGSNFTTTINVPEGTAITTQWTTGSYLSECSFNIVVGGSTIHTGVMTTAANIASQMYSGSVPSYNYTFAWYSAATGGNLLGTGATLETIGTSVLPNLNTAGQYTVYAVQSNACVSAATPAIVNVTNVLAQIVPINASCNSVANGSFSLGTITCGTTPFTYSVDGSAFGAIPTNLAYGNHTVIVKDATGAVAPSVTIFIDQPTWITNVPNFVDNGWACKDATSETIAVANPNLSLTNTISLGNVSIGGYGVATLNPALNLPVGAVITSATLNLTGMTTAGGTWANDLTVVASGLGSTNQVPAGLTVTNANYSYPLTSINPNGTSINVVVTNTYGFGTAVINNVSLVVSYTIQQTLDNVTWYAAPTGGSSVASGFTIESVGTSVLPNTVTPGIYNFYAQGELNGCSSFTRQLVTVEIQAPTIVANLNTSTVCPGDFLTLNATGGLTYTWSNGAGQNTPFVPAPTNYVGATQSYVVNGFDIDGCANQDTVVVTVLPQPILNAGVDQAVCSGIPVILNASTTAQTATAVTGILWSNSIPNNTQFVPTTTGVLTATATGANGCTTQDAVQITVLALPVVNAGNDITVCAGLSATLTATGANTYAWNNNVSQAIPFYPTATQTYTVTGIATNGCTNQDQVVVTISTGPTVTVSGPQVVCANAPASLSAAATNSMGGFWTTSNGTGVISPNVSNGTVTYTPSANDPAVVNLTYIASNACGNVSQATTLTVLPVPTVDAGPDLAACSGLPVTLNATGTGFLTWNNGVSNNVAFVPTTSGTYTVTAVGTNNCSNTDQMIVTVLALPDVNAGADQTICSGSNVTLSGSGANTYAWNNAVVNNVAFAPSTSQTYTVTGTAINGCQSSDDVVVTVNATPVAAITVIDDITLAATPAGMNYQWINCASGTDIPAATTADFTATVNGAYAVIVTSLQGCEDVSDCITIDAVGLDQLATIEMSVQPNPTLGELTINMPTTTKASAQVFDAQGKLIQTELNVVNGTVLNLASLTTGVYMVRVSTENAIQTFRVVKQ